MQYQNLVTLLFATAEFGEYVSKTYIRPYLCDVSRPYVEKVDGKIKISYENETLRAHFTRDYYS